ncbi:hypothetical protein C1646_820987 [Rhizophagus diaphanus]|nr:hypothetical protein C1646_820987 [Rhizophagus diaphanus] [Rhizophagus sp. MUCL 43196]
MPREGQPRHVLNDDAKPIVNRKERIKKHLTNCEHFWNKYKEEAEKILGNCDVDEKMPPSKHICIDDDGTSISSFHTNSTSSSFNLSCWSSKDGQRSYSVLRSLVSTSPGLRRTGPRS